MDTKPYMTTAEASTHLAERWGLRLRPSTLARRRTAGGGPRYIRPNGRDPLYPSAELDAWAEGLGNEAVSFTAEEPCMREDEGERAASG